jgi:hypothetical protein
MYSKNEYNLIEIKKSKAKNKKYAAIIQNKKTNRNKTINFGDKRYQHFHDKIGDYSNLDHNDPKRRANYKARHSANSFEPYSANYFSLKYLW